MPDVITQIVAIVALIVSGITAYFNWRKVLDVGFSLVDLNTSELPDHTRAIAMRFSLINRGDVPAQITAMRMIVPFAENASALQGERAARDAGGEVIESITVKPKDLQHGLALFPLNQKTISRLGPVDSGRICVDVAVRVMQATGEWLDRKIAQFYIRRSSHADASLASFAPSQVATILPVPKDERRQNILT